MYARDTDTIVLRPGSRGAEHAGERFAQGGTSENDLLPRNGELDMYRVIVRGTLPETVLAGMIGRRVHEIITIPPFRGNCSRLGGNLGGDTLNRMADLEVTHVRPVERGTLIAIAPDRRLEHDGPWPGHR